MIWYLSGKKVFEKYVHKKHKNFLDKFYFPNKDGFGYKRNSVKIEKILLATNQLLFINFNQKKKEIVNYN